jgi:hypothetical protein
MAATLMTPLIAQATGYSTANLLPHCRGVDSFCTGYLVAMVDAEDEIAGDAKRFCVPKGVAVEQLSSIFVKYAAAHAEKQYDSAARLVRLSLSERYPCRQARCRSPSKAPSSEAATALGAMTSWFHCAMLRRSRRISSRLRM